MISEQIPMYILIYVLPMVMILLNSHNVFLPLVSTSYIIVDFLTLLVIVYW